MPIFSFPADPPFLEPSPSEAEREMTPEQLEQAHTDALRRLSSRAALRSMLEQCCLVLVLALAASAVPSLGSLWLVWTLLFAWRVCLDAAVIKTAVGHALAGGDEGRSFEEHGASVAFTEDMRMLACVWMAFFLFAVACMELS